jgi:hypothetical protein
VKPQTHAFLERSRDQARTLRRIEQLNPSVAVGAAYLLTGRFDAGLAERAQKLQVLREGVDYRAETADSEEAADAVRDARRFVRAIDELLGLDPPQSAR